MDKDFLYAVYVQVDCICFIRIGLRVTFNDSAFSKMCVEVTAHLEPVYTVQLTLPCKPTC